MKSCLSLLVPFFIHGAHAIELSPSIQLDFLYSNPCSSSSCFARPDGSLDKKIEQLLKHSVPGSEIHGTLFKATNTGLAKSFVKAHKRGANVKFVLDGVAREEKKYKKVYKKLKEGLGKENITVCKPKACIGTNSNHNKFYLFSKIRNPLPNARTEFLEHVVVQTSANPGLGQHYNFNDMLVFYGDKALYDHYLDYWHDLTANVQIPNYMETARGQGQGSPGTKIEIRRSPATDLDSSLLIQTLDQATCQEGDEILVGHSYFKGKMAQQIFSRLVELKKEGCQVALILRGDSGHNAMKKELRKSSLWAFKIDSSIAKIHSKFVLVRAHFGDGENLVKKKIVLTGSFNIKDGALLRNDETLLKIENAELYSKYHNYWYKMKAASKKL